MSIGFLGIILMCTTPEVSTCMITTSPSVFETKEQCVGVATAVSDGMMSKGILAIPYCVEVKEQPKGEAL